MTVREDTIERPDGSSGIFGVVEKLDFVLVIPSSDDGFYLVEQYRYPVGSRFSEFPQGSWEGIVNPDPLEVARGELEEETGLHAGSMRYLGHLLASYGFSTQGFHVFLASDLLQATSRLSIEEQDLRMHWASEEEFRGMIRAGWIKDASTIAAYGLLLLNREEGPT